MRSRIFNFRAFIIVALFVTAVVFCVYCYAYNAVAGLVLGILCIIACGILCGIFIYRFVRNKSRLVVGISFSLATVLCICAFSVGVCTADRWESGAKIEGYCSVSGRLCDIDTQMETYRLYLDELTVDGNDTDGVLCVYIRVSDKNIADIVQCGDILQFGAKINAIKLADENGTINGSAYRTDVRYIASVKSGDIVQVFGESRLLEKFTSLLKNHLTDNMGEKYGNIAFSMLTGDRHGLDYDISSYFSAVGLGHIMAVSGLHIGFFVFLLNLILRKVSKKVRFPIIAAVLIMYAVLADFSPSVVRAVIMVFISGVGILIGGRRDLLSSLLCAYSFILAVKPFYMFEVGFLLSFGALFGIAVFSGMIRRFLQKNGAYKKIADAIGGSVSATLGIIPAESYFFGNIQLLAAVVNVFLLPYISVVFISVICLLPISAIPYCGSVLTVCKYLLMALDYAAYGISNIPYTIITFSAAGAVFFCYPVMFMAGEHAMLGKSKTAVSWYSLAVCVAIIVLCVL